MRENRTNRILFWCCCCCGRRCCHTSHFCLRVCFFSQCNFAYFPSLSHTCVLRLCALCLFFRRWFINILYCCWLVHSRTHQTKMNVTLSLLLLLLLWLFCSLYSVCRLLLANTATTETSEFIQHTQSLCVCVSLCARASLRKIWMYSTTIVITSTTVCLCICFMCWVQHTVTASWRKRVCVCSLVTLNRLDGGRSCYTSYWLLALSVDPNSCSPMKWNISDPTVRDQTTSTHLIHFSIVANGKAYSKSTCAHAQRWQKRVFIFLLMMIVLCGGQQQKSIASGKL